MGMFQVIRALVLTALLAITGSSFAAAWDVGIDQRNAADNSWVVRLLFSPTTDGLMLYNTTTRLPQWVTLGDGLTRDGAVLNYQQADWTAISGKGVILNRPVLSTVATSGQYSDLAGRPVIPAAQVQVDWNSASGLSSIANKPSLAAVATSGSYADLSGRPAIPAAQVNADWNATTGLAQVLNKPALFDGTWASLTGKPTFATVATTGSYTDLSNRPSLFDGTWASLSGKPAWTGTFTGAYSTLTGIPSAFTPSVHTHAAADIVSGTLADERIPALAIAKTTGLQAALNGKLNTPSGTTSDYVRGDGSVAAFPSLVPVIGSPTARTVSLATAYQCTNAARPCYLTLTLQLQSSISLSGTSNNEGAVTIGATTGVATGTGTNIAVYKNNLGGGLVVGLSITSQQANTYTVAIPAGQYFAVRQTAGTGLQVVSAFDQSL